MSQLCRRNWYVGPHYVAYVRTDTHLVMAGLEGAPRAVESHLHRRQGQIGHIVLATLCVVVLHLEERTGVEKEVIGLLCHDAPLGQPAPEIQELQ